MPTRTPEPKHVPKHANLVSTRIRLFWLPLPCSLHPCCSVPRLLPLPRAVRLALALAITLAHNLMHTTAFIFLRALTLIPKIIIAIIIVCALPPPAPLQFKLRRLLP